MDPKKSLVGEMQFRMSLAEKLIVALDNLNLTLDEIETYRANEPAMRAHPPIKQTLTILLTPGGNSSNDELRMYSHWNTFLYSLLGVPSEEMDEVNKLRHENLSLREQLAAARDQIDLMTGDDVND